MSDHGDAAAFAKSFLQLMADVHRIAGDAVESPLPAAIAQHLGVDPRDLPIVEQTFPVPDHPNIQLTLEEIAAASPGCQLFGLPVEVLHWQGFGLSNLASSGAVHGMQFAPVAPAYVNVAVDVDRTLPCLTIGVWLLKHAGAPVAALMSLGDPHRGLGVGVKLEVMSTDRDVAVDFLSTVERLAHLHNVYRGKVLSFSFHEWGPRFLKELCRRSVLLAAERTDPNLPLVIRQEHLIDAIDDLLAHSSPVLLASLGAFAVDASHAQAYPTPAHDPWAEG